MSAADAGPAPAALAAFLRGVERRAWAFLWLQGGRAEAAGPALAAAIRAFATQAGTTPMAQWPVRFWRLLAAAPLPGRGPWPEELEALSGLAPEARRAVLLRWIAGLEEAPAAQALGVDEAQYRRWLAQACPRDADGAADAAAWRRLAQAAQQAGRDLPPRRLLEIAGLREAALAGPGAAVAAGVAGAAARAPAAVADRRGYWAALVALLCAAALAATWWAPEADVGREADASAVAAAEPGEGAAGLSDPGPVLVEPLPPVPDRPAAAVPPAAPAGSMPDAAGDALAWLSWHAAGAPEPGLVREADPRLPLASPALPQVPVDGLYEAAARHAGWRSLDPGERVRLDEAARALEALPEAERAELLARFARFDRAERRGWRLGPVLGADYAALHPLLGYVEPGQREPLLAALKTMTPAQRARVAELARRAAPGERDRLRRELLAQPPAGWDAWLARRADSRPGG